MNDFNLTNALLNNKMSDEYLQQMCIASYSWETPQRKIKSFGLLQGHVSFDDRVGLKTRNTLEVVTGKLGGLLCPFRKKVLYMKDHRYSQETGNSVNPE